MAQSRALRECLLQEYGAIRRKSRPAGPPLRHDVTDQYRHTDSVAYVLRQRYMSERGDLEVIQRYLSGVVASIVSVAHPLSSHVAINVRGTAVVVTNKLATGALDQFR